MAGFIRIPNNTLLPLAIDNSDLEALLFPNLFLNEKGHYYDILSNSNFTCEETYSKYIK